MSKYFRNLEVVDNDKGKMESDVARRACGVLGQTLFNTQGDFLPDRKRCWHHSRLFNSKVVNTDVISDAATEATTGTIS